MLEEREFAPGSAARKRVDTVECRKGEGGRRLTPRSILCVAQKQSVTQQRNTFQRASIEKKTPALSQHRGKDAIFDAVLNCSRVTQIRGEFSVRRLRVSMSCVCGSRVMRVLCVSYASSMRALCMCYACMVRVLCVCGARAMRIL